MSVPKALPGSLIKFISRRQGARLQQIRSEASQRRFFRISWKKQTRIAMVYPEPSRDAVGRFMAFQTIYRSHGLRVPRIHDVLGDQVVLQEDAGGLLLQKAWREGGRSERQCLLDMCREILIRLAAVPLNLTSARLDKVRLLWEMGFFFKHFFPRYPVRNCAGTGLRAALATLVGKLESECVFAHRDFHSRNLLVLGKEIVMVDFQDSLIAPRFYDCVSLAFDSYMDLGRARDMLLPDRGLEENESRQMRLTALQRNIKALGTFAFQVHENRHPAYVLYIPRTIRYIQGHLRELGDPELEGLNKYFNALNK
jgi:aminoglycoside/choline kinase family phosphotransferase